MCYKLDYDSTTSIINESDVIFKEEPNENLFWYEANNNSGNHFDAVGYHKNMFPVATRAKETLNPDTQRGAVKEMFLSKRTGTRVNDKNGKSYCK